MKLTKKILCAALCSLTYCLPFIATDWIVYKVNAPDEQAWHLLVPYAVGIVFLVFYFIRIFPFRNNDCFRPVKTLPFTIRLLSVLFAAMLAIVMSSFSVFVYGGIHITLGIVVFILQLPELLQDTILYWNGLPANQQFTYSADIEIRHNGRTFHTDIHADTQDILKEHVEGFCMENGLEGQVEVFTSECIKGKQEYGQGSLRFKADVKNSFKKSMKPHVINN